jgi:hypothetical protein
LLKVLAAVAPLAVAASVRADDVTYFEKNGVTYRETHTKVQRPITELRYNDQRRTVYREQLNTSTQTVNRTYHAPVTEYQTRSKLVGRWNPFVRQPYYEHTQVPVTRWQQRSEAVQVPVTTRSIVPETTTVRVPVASTRIVEDEVIHRVAVGTRPTVAAAPPAAAPVASIAPAPPQIAARPAAGPRYGSVQATAPMPVVVTQPSSAAQPSAVSQASTVGAPVAIGGISKLDSDPPRVGNNVPWRRADVSRR